MKNRDKVVKKELKEIKGGREKQERERGGERERESERQERRLQEFLSRKNI